MITPNEDGQEAPMRHAVKLGPGLSMADMLPPGQRCYSNGGVIRIGHEFDKDGKCFFCSVKDTAPVRKTLGLPRS